MSGVYRLLQGLISCTCLNSWGYLNVEHDWKNEDIGLGVCCVYNSVPVCNKPIAWQDGADFVTM